MSRKKYYIVWIEGLSARYGEKLKTFNDDDHTYTLKMTEAMRVKPEHVETLKDRLREKGFADWCVDSFETFIPTYYAPSGTIWKP